MIPKNVREGAVAVGLDGEKAYFTIAANGKAFRTLIDGLYSNKIRAVIRELCSNAADSHIDAGQTKPFKVSIPTSLDPVFRVRDFGTALRHDQVMHLYTTIFQSTKEETNTQTGQLGLGSKSPFAYTDSFQVTVWLDGVKRQYLAYLERDGVPSITHVGDTPSDEPRGLEVSFPAERGDIRQFQREMQFVSLGYAEPPEVDGMSLVIPKPRISGKGWAIYPSGSFGEEMRGTSFVRQGSVIYPNDSRPFPNLGYGWISVIEIPIGTAEVTASRESLSYDNDTTLAINTILRGAADELKAQIDAVMAKAVTRLEKAKVFSEYNGIMSNLKGSTNVSILSDKSGDRCPGDSLERADFFGKSANGRGQYQRYVSGFDFQQLHRIQILVNEPEIKIVRRNKRIQIKGANCNHYVLDVHQPERQQAIDWIKQCLGFDDSKFTLVSSLPDCPPAPSQRKPSTKRVLATGQMWMTRWEGRVQSDIYGVSDRGIGEWPDQMVKIAKILDFPMKWDDVFWVTEKQRDSFQKKGVLPDNRRLDTVLKVKMDAKIKTMRLEEAVTAVTVVEYVGRYSSALPVVLANFFPDVSMSQDAANSVVHMAQLAKIDVTKLPIYATVKTTVRELANQFPLLFQKSDRSHYEQYVNAIKAITPVNN